MKKIFFEHQSPNNDFTARAYLIVGGASTRKAIRIVIDFGNEIKTIYWSYVENTVKIKWLVLNDSKVV
ncbi:DUF5412 family protein [Viridibacillus arvi]|uniref:DUF5412 family protein n=1 Tax=Viridibacillus arvi TaxID=263475 RepID=UPI003D0483E0